MSSITYVKAHVFHDLSAAIKLANKKPSPKNITLLQKLSGVENIQMNLTKKIGDVVFEQQADILLGKTIAPKIASSKLGKVLFNGYGEIVALPAALKKRDFKVFLENITQSLKEAPVKNSEEKIRTTAECTIDMACVIKKSNIPDNIKFVLENELKSIYLSESSSVQTLGLFLKYAITRLDKSPAVLNKLELLLNSIEKQFYVTKHNDNYYGRSFESTVAEMIIDKPSEEMKKSTEIIKNKLLKDFLSLDKNQQEKLINSIKSDMVKDPAIWREDITEAKTFLDKCTSGNFIEMLNSKNPINHLLVMHLAVKYVISSPNFRDMKNDASTLYVDVIERQRDFHRVINNQELSNRTGIKLSYQPQSNARLNRYGVRPIDRYQPSVDNLTEHNREALISERPIGIGMSGSSNILNHLFISLDDGTSGFNIEQARLLAASFLTYSGGHSINEAYTVFGYKDNKSFKPVNYISLIESDRFTKEIINNSYNKLIDEAMILNDM